MPTVIIVYCVFVTAASLAGGELPSLIRLTHARMQVFVSLVAGLVLGVGLFHMLPHAAAEVNSLDTVMSWVMGGLLTTFFLIRAFHFHQHGPVENDAEPESGGHRDHDHDHGHDHDAGQHGAGSHRMSWVGMGLGLSIHTLLDGAAMAASVQADSHLAGDSWWLGLGTFLAVLLHKPLDAMSITSLMAVGGWPKRWRQRINLSYSLLCPLGAALFWFGANAWGGGSQAVAGCALAFSAGVFLCISLSDLLPEVQFHSHDRLKLSAALLLGIAAAWGLRYLEPAHAHQRPDVRSGSHD
jgi:zinc and cadmium transporter